MEEDVYVRVYICGITVTVGLFIPSVHLRSLLIPSVSEILVHCSFHVP